MAFDLSRVLATQSHYICIIIVPIQPLSMLKKMLYNYTQLEVLGQQQLRGLGQWVGGAQRGDADGAKSNVLHLLRECCQVLPYSVLP